MRTIAWKTLTAGVIMSAVTLSAIAQTQDKASRRKGSDSQSNKTDGANSKRGAATGKGQGRGGMPMFKVGAVIPPFMVDQLDLSSKQKADIDKLEADVAKKLKEILDDDQYEMLSRPPQMGPGGPGGQGFGPGGPGFGPQGGRGFGPGGPGGPGGEDGGPPAKGARGKGEARRKPAPPPEDQ